MEDTWIRKEICIWTFWIYIIVTRLGIVLFMTGGKMEAIFYIFITLFLPGFPIFVQVCGLYVNPLQK